MCVCTYDMCMVLLVYGARDNITLHYITLHRRMIADVLQEIQQYQNSPYCLTQEQSIQVPPPLGLWTPQNLLYMSQNDHFPHF